MLTALKEIFDNSDSVREDAMSEMMKTVWSQLGLNITLTPDEEKVFRQVLNDLFSNTDQIYNRRAMEDSINNLIKIFHGHLKGHWDRVLPERSRRDIMSLARRENLDEDVIAAEWIVQKIIMGMMEIQYTLDDVDEFDASKNPAGYVLFSRNGSIVIADGLDYNQKNEPIRNAVYLRAPSRKKGEWAGRFEKTGDSDSALKVGERGKTPIVNTSNVRQILAIPEKQLRNLNVIIETYRASITTCLVGN
jgi:hypothetical protein